MIERTLDIYGTLVGLSNARIVDMNCRSNRIGGGTYNGLKKYRAYSS